VSATDSGAAFSPEQRRRFDQQEALRDDVAVVVEYGAGVDEEAWGGLWFDNDRDPVVLVAAVTRRADEHAAFLRTLVSSPRGSSTSSESTTVWSPFGAFKMRSLRCVISFRSQALVSMSQAASCTSVSPSMIPLPVPNSRNASGRV